MLAFELHGQPPASGSPLCVASGSLGRVRGAGAMTLARLRLPRFEPALFPFADDAGGLLVGTCALRDLHKRAAAGAGHDVVDTPADAPIPAGAAVACTLDAVFSRATVAALVAEAERRGAVVQAAIRAGTPLWRAASRLVVGGVEGDMRLPLWAGPLAGRTAKVDGDALDAFPDATLVAVCDEATATTFRVPPHGPPPHVLEIARVAKLGGRLTHWLHVLDLSLAAKETARVELGLVDGRNVLGKRVDVHPTATVIGSILEDGVKLEQHASVIDSYVGKDALIADHTMVHSSVIGDRCRTLVDAGFQRIVAMEDSTLSNLGMSDTILGRHVFLTMSVATFGPDPGETALVDGVDSGRAALGAAIGSRCVLGSRALLRAGTALPPGILVVARPGEAVTKLDDDALARAASMRGDRGENA